MPSVAAGQRGGQARGRPRGRAPGPTGREPAAPRAGQGREAEAGGPGLGPRLPRQPGRAPWGAGSSTQRRPSAGGGAARLAAACAACSAAALPSARLLPFPPASPVAGSIPAGAPRAAGRCSGAAASLTGAACAEPPGRGWGSAAPFVRPCQAERRGLRQPGRRAGRRAGAGAGGQAGRQPPPDGGGPGGEELWGVGGLRAGAGLRRGGTFSTGLGALRRPPPPPAGSAGEGAAGTGWSAEAESGTVTPVCGSSRPGPKGV